MLINAIAALGALAVIDALGWRFGLPSDSSPTAVSVMQVLVAGLSSAALFRSSLFTVRMGQEDVGIGPSAVLDVILRAVDRAVDRRRAIARLQILSALQPNLSFERDATVLAAIAMAALQNVSLDEAERLGHQANSLRVRNDIPDDVKMRVFALDLMQLVGEAGLRAAIDQLDQPRPVTPEPVPSFEDMLPRR